MYLTANILHQWNISWRTDVALLDLSAHIDESLPVEEASEYEFESRIYYGEFKHNKKIMDEIH